MTELTRVAYLSSNGMDLDDEGMIEAINEILSVSQEKNKKAGITGALIFNRGFFGQILEGPPDSVDATFERIQNDERHYDVTVLDAKPITQRSFRDWSMGFVGSDEVLAKAAKTQFESVEFNMAMLTGDTMFELLSRIAMDRELADSA